MNQVQYILIQKNKKPVFNDSKEWIFVSYEEAKQRVQSGSPIAIVPSSFRSFVFDIDDYHGKENERNDNLQYLIEEWQKEFGIEPICLPSTTRGRYHAWIPIGSQIQFQKGKETVLGREYKQSNLWHKFGYTGETRFDTGYIAIPTLDYWNKLHDKIENQSYPASIDAVKKWYRTNFKTKVRKSITNLVQKLVQIPEGERNNKLNELTYIEASRGRLTAHDLDTIETELIANGFMIDNPAEIRPTLQSALESGTREFRTNGSKTHGGYRQGSGRPADSITCSIDHEEFDDKTKREIEARNRIWKLHSIAYINDAFHIKNKNDLWIEKNQHSERDAYHKLTLSELELCKHCRNDAQPHIFAQAHEDKIDADSKGKVLVKTRDAGYKVLDATHQIGARDSGRSIATQYTVRDPEPEDYLTNDRYIEWNRSLDELTEFPNYSQSPLLDYLLAPIDQGGWNWSPEDYDFLIAMLSRGLFQCSGDRTLFLIAPSGSGKGTLLETIIAAIGNYATKLRAKEFAQSRFEASQMINRGIVIFDEHVNSTLINRINSYTDSYIQVEKKFQDTRNIYFGGLIIFSDTKLPSMNRYGGELRRSAIMPNENIAARQTDDGGEIKSQIVHDSADPLLIDILRSAYTQGLFSQLELTENVEKSTNATWNEADSITSWINENLIVTETQGIRLNHEPIPLKEVRDKIINELSLSPNGNMKARIKETLERHGFQIEGNKQVECYRK